MYVVGNLLSDLDTGEEDVEKRRKRAMRGLVVGRLLRLCIGGESSSALFVTLGQ